MPDLRPRATALWSGFRSDEIRSAPGESQPQPAPNRLGRYPHLRLRAGIPESFPSFLSLLSFVIFVIFVVNQSEEAEGPQLSPRAFARLVSNDYACALARRRRNKPDNPSNSMPAVAGSGMTVVSVPAPLKAVVP